MLYNIVITLILLSITIIRVLCYTDHIVQGNRWSLIDQRANSDRQLSSRIPSSDKARYYDNCHSER